ncbi:MAG: glycosyltransferase family A protein [Proteobacteria bacterium]|nr:glycosyltransferase family A protein [Pseudomonadota bacterium]
MPPKVSINLCCYNSEKYLAETLQSIENQTFRDWELIVINDGSSDSTESMIMEFKDRGFPVTYHYQENRGLGYSRNRALEFSQGEYITFIDHDDLWLPEKLAMQVAAFEKRNDIDFIYTNYFVLKDGQKKLAFRKPNPDGDVFGRFLRQYSAGYVTVAIRMSAIRRLGEYFDTNFRLCEEYDFFMRILFQSKAIYIRDPLAVYRIHSERASTRYIDEWPREMEDIMEKYKKTLKGFKEKYAATLRYVYGKIGYYRARAEMSKQNCEKAREYLRPYLGIDFRFLLLYLMTFLPAFVWRRAVSMESKGYFDT